MKKILSLITLSLICCSNSLQADENLTDKTISKTALKSIIKQVPTKVVTFNVLPATSEARRWLKTLDKKQFGDAWEKASILVRQTVTKEEFIKQATRSREPLGSFIKREILMAQPKTELPGAPKGQYVLITFKSDFFNNHKVSETVMIQKDPDNSWRVAGYYVI